MAVRKSISLMRSENAINYILSSSTPVRGYIESYQNGREQGHTVVYDHKNVFYIAEHRKIDKVVVYFGSMSMQSISEDAHKNRYMEDSERDAAVYILKELCKLQGVKFQQDI